MSIPASLFSVLLSAILLSLGIPNEFFKLGSAVLGLAALVPLYVALLKAPNWRRGGLLGGLMMMLVHLMSSFWLANFKEFAIFTLGGSALLNFFFGFLAGALLWYALRFPEHLRPFLFAAVYMIWEWFKSTGFFAYPWGTLVMTSRELLPLIQIADLTGTWGISFILALVSAVIAEGVLLGPTPASMREAAATRRSAAFTALLVLASCIYGLVALSASDVPETELNVVMVQQNGDSWEEGGVRKTMLASQKLTRKGIAAGLAAGGKKTDLVVWSESVLGWPYIQNKDYYAGFPKEDPFAAFMAEIDTPLLVGSPVLVDPVNEGYSNSVILVSPEAEQIDWYAKIQLVAFAEYMPFTEYEWVRTFFDAIVGFSRGWVPGNSLEPFTVKNGEGREIRFAAPICFEDAFSPLIAKLHNEGSNLLINLTNDSWSKTDSAEYQHFAIASFRSIELRTTMIRSTNAGYSVVIDPKGRVIHDMPLFVADALFASVPVYPHRTTFYARFGDWLPALFSALLFLVFAFGRNNKDFPKSLSPGRQHQGRIQR